VDPIGVVTLTFLVPAVRVQVALTVVEVDPVTVQLFLVPDTVTAVAPARFAPERVSTTPVPCVTGFGVIEASVGPCTVIDRVLLAPAGLATVTVCAPSAALVPIAIANVAVIVVGLIIVTALMVIPPAGATATVVPVVVKLTPVRVTEVVVVPRTNVLGVTEFSVGSGGATAVKVSVLLVPPGAVTLTARAVSPAVAVIAKVAVTVVSFTTERPL
jgi:hypothetical protein